MSDTDTEITYRTIYDRPYAPFLDQFEEGDVAYLHYFAGAMVGHQRLHGVVTSTTDDELVVEARAGGTYSPTVDGGEVTMDTGRAWEVIEESSIYHLERIPKTVAADPEWRTWEVHLCVSQAHESSDDQVLYPEAASREQAVEIAQRRADRDLPEVGPVYDEGTPREVNV